MPDDIKIQEMYTRVEAAIMNGERPNLSDRVAMASLGCGNGYCHLRGNAKGMHTNGGCRCVDDLLYSARNGDEIYASQVLRTVLWGLHHGND